MRYYVQTSLIDANGDAISAEVSATEFDRINALAKEAGDQFVVCNPVPDETRFRSRDDGSDFGGPA